MSNCLKELTSLQAVKNNLHCYKKDIFANINMGAIVAVW